MRLFTKWKANRERAQRERQERIERENQERAQRDLEWAAHAALMQNSTACFDEADEFKEVVTIEDSTVQLQSKGNPKAGERVTEVTVTSPNRRLTLREAYTSRAKRFRHEIHEVRACNLH
jgi:hypothetical protein